LGEVGTGLVGFYNVSGYVPALADAFGLAQYFLTDYQDGSGRGIWSPTIGAWLVGPWPGSGAEHFTNQVYNRVAWGSSQLMAAEFLLSLRKHSQDAALQARMADKCVKAFEWCIDACQFEDGAHGMFGRDDKWVGQGAAAILLYAGLKEQNLVPPDLDKIYRPRIEKSWQWMLNHTHRDTFPADGYIKVSGTTTKKPLENLVWRMAWTTEALIVGERVFAS
jgi:hypothetical protein